MNLRKYRIVNELMRQMKPMKQLSLAETGFLPKVGKQSRKVVFLAEMETVAPWSRLEAFIEPVYPKKGNARTAMPLVTILRNYFLQQWFAYPDPAQKEALHDEPMLSQFLGLNAFEDIMPDESATLRFRQQLEIHDLAVAIFNDVNALPSEKGLSMQRGTVADATLIAAPSSTRNEYTRRNPVMKQPKKLTVGTQTDQQKIFKRTVLLARAIVKHPFRVVKRQYAFVNVCYRALTQNTVQIVALFALANPWIAQENFCP